MITECIILCGGKGTRLNLPDTPKALVSINGRTLLQRQMRYLFSQGIQKIILALGYDYGKIVIALTSDPSLRARQHKGFVCSHEKEPLGTAGAIKLALSHITTDRFLICNVDDLVNIPLQNAAQMGDNVLCLGNFKCPFGVVQTHGNDIIGFQEKPFLKEVFVSTGFAIVKKTDIQPLLPIKGSLETDVYPKMFFKAYKHLGYWHTVNDLKQKQETEEFFNGVEK